MITQNYIFSFASLALWKSWTGESCSTYRKISVCFCSSICVSLARDVSYRNDCRAILEVAWHRAQRRTIKLTCIISIAFWSSSERACIERQSQRLSILRVSTHKLVPYCAGARLSIRHRHRTFAGRSNYLYQAVNCPELSFLVIEIKHLRERVHNLQSCRA